VVTANINVKADSNWCR